MESLVGSGEDASHHYTLLHTITPPPKNASKSLFFLSSFRSALPCVHAQQEGGRQEALRQLFLGLEPEQELELEEHEQQPQQLRDRNSRSSGGKSGDRRGPYPPAGARGAPAGTRCTLAEPEEGMERGGGLGRRPFWTFL